MAATLGIQACRHVDKYPVRGSSVSESTDARGQKTMARLVRVDKKAMATINSNNHLLQLRHAQEHFWTHNMANLEADELQQQKTTPLSLLLAENSKQSLQFTQAHQNWRIEDWKRVPGLMSLHFWCDSGMVGSELGENNMKAWIHPAMNQWFRVVVMV